MPKRSRIQLGRKTQDSKRKCQSRDNETKEQTEQRLTTNRVCKAAYREHETDSEETRENETIQETDHSCARQGTSRGCESIAQREERLRDARERARQRRSNETVLQTDSRRASNATRDKQRRTNETDLQTDQRRASDTTRHKQTRSNETNLQTDQRRASDAAHRKQTRSNETELQTDQRRAYNTTRHMIQRQNKRTVTLNLGRKTDVSEFCEEEIPDEYKKHYLGKLTDVTCVHCKAYRWKMEREGLCCCKGTVELDPVPSPPDAMKPLFDIRSHGKEFLTNIRLYNNAMALASLGCNEIRHAGFNPTFTIQGKLYHKIGTLLPSDNQSPKFAQLYFWDQENETRNRLGIHDKLKEDILNVLTEVLRTNNTYITSLYTALELIKDTPDVGLRLHHADKTKTPVGHHKGRYNLPNTSEVSVIIPGEKAHNLDVVLHARDGNMKHILPIHRSYDPLHYVVMFPYGTDGWKLGMTKSNGTTLTALNYYSYRCQVRRDDFNIVMKCRKLTQQYACDMWSKIEASKMKWVEDNQDKIKADKYNGLYDAQTQGDLVNAGRRIILPPSIYGSPRFYSESFQNAMAIVRSLGKPDVFITFTCNPKWSEITEALHEGEQAHDRPDITCRVFKLKFTSLMDDILKKNILGKVKAHTATIEFQKRGLPHAHILLILEEEYKPNTPEKVDKIVSAEIPDPVMNPELYNVITTSNVHGPCGAVNPNCVCMDGVGAQRKCTKDFPKRCQSKTTLPGDSYPEYRRRSPEDGGRTHMTKVKGHDFELDNSFIVPYNPLLSLRYKAHINVEVVFSIQCVKYLYKYLTKGQDRVIMQVGANERVLNEIDNFLNARYISGSEAYWRIFEFPIHQKSPSVVKLPLHLPDEQTVLFRNEQEAAAALERGPPDTMLTAYFQKNAEDEGAHHILYPDFPKYFTWNQKEKTWQRRRRGKKDEETDDFHTDAIGRVPTISFNPHQSERFYLRMLLYKKTGAASYEDMRTVDDEVCETFQEACCRMGLLETDDEKDKVIEEIAALRSGHHLRTVFATLLLYCRPSKPLEFWERHKLELCRDLMYRDNVQEPTHQIINEVLMKIQDRLDHDNVDIHFDCKLPAIDRDRLPVDIEPRIIIEETSYNTDLLTTTIQPQIESLNEDQRQIYNDVMQSIRNDEGKLFGLQASGGTGKTYTLNLILDTARSEGIIALGTALSGIAATLLHNGRTLHSRCKVPIVINEHSTCHISPRDATGKLIARAKVLVIDEVGMGHKHIFEAIDRTFQDVRKNDQLFGGMTILFATDWRQGLPIVPHGSRAQIIDACLKSSPIWQNVHLYELQHNMRVEREGEDPEFTEYLMKCGDGKLPIHTDLGEYKTQLWDDLAFDGHIGDLCGWVYENLEDKWTRSSWLGQRAIICPTNKTVDDVNNRMMKLFPGEKRVYTSCDSVEEDAHQYPHEFLNSLTPSGMPPHTLTLKKGCPIMLLRNMDPSNGHCNGTKYTVTKLHDRIIEAKVSTGSFRGNIIFIPRIKIVPSENLFPFTFRRLQFPIRPCFAITSDKSQGQTLRRVGVYLDKPFFSHGRKYVSESRVGKKSAVKVLVKDGVFPNKTGIYTDNVVYSEVL